MKSYPSIGTIKRAMKDELKVRFCEAFFGGGSNWDRAVVAFDIADYYEQWGRSDVAYLYEKIAEFYSRKSANPRQGKISQRDSQFSYRSR